MAKARDYVTVSSVIFRWVHANGEDLLEKLLTDRHEGLRAECADFDSGVAMNRTVGKVATGITDEKSTELTELLEAYYPRPLY